MAEPLGTVPETGLGNGEQKVKNASNINSRRR
jgi:hypothetical protein